MGTLLLFFLSDTRYDIGRKCTAYFSFKINLSCQHSKRTTHNSKPNTVTSISVLSPYFLFGLAAMALPILYHFVRKVKAKKVRFSSLMFLTATPKELIKRRRLRDLVLMAMRAALFGLLALMFARPFIPQDKLPFFSSPDAESVAFLLDTSYSLGHADSFESLKSTALTEIGKLNEDDEATIITFSDFAKQEIPLSEEPSLLTSFVESRLSTTYRGTDFYQAFRLAEEVLEDSKHEDKRIIVISDFQSNAWSGPMENWKLDPEIRFESISVAQESQNNAAIEDLAVTQKRRGDQVALRYDSRISPSQATTSNLLVDDTNLGSQKIPSGASRRITYQNIAPRTGVFRAELSLGDDDLAADNAFYFTYSVNDRPSILVLEDGHREALSDAFFLDKVFGLGESSLYQFESAPISRLSRSQLRGQSVVFLPNLSSLSSGQTGILREYVEQGGKLILSFGPASNPSRLSASLNTLDVGNIESIVTARSAQGSESIVGEIDIRHPIFSLFGDVSSGAILRPKFRRYARIEEAPNATVIAKFDSGDPFLIENSLGQGKVITYTSSINTSWTDFAVQESFVPFLYQLVSYTQESANQITQFKVGEIVSLPNTSGSEWEIRTPDASIFKLQPDSSNSAYFRETELPGHYLAVQGSSSFAFSVNVDPEESQLDYRDIEEVYASVVPPMSEFEGTSEQLAAINLVQEEKGQKFWRILLLFIIALFCAETFLANRVFIKKKS